MSLWQRLSGNEKFSRFFKTVKTRMTEAEIGNSSAVIAYYLLLSIFPLIIAVGNILPYLRINPDTVLVYMAQAMPETVYHLLRGTVENLLINSNGGLLSISAVTTLWAASKSVNALQIAMNKIYGVKKRTNLIIVRLFSFIMVFFFLAAIVLVVAVFGLGQIILDYLQPIFNLPQSIAGLFGTLKWPATMIVLFVIMSSIYYFIPNAKIRFRSVLPGAIFTSIGWMILSQVFGLYARYFSKGITSYGVIGSFIVFMLWLNFAARLIIIGGIANAVTEELNNGEIATRESRIGDLIDKKLGRMKKK